MGSSSNNQTVMTRHELFVYLNFGVHMKCHLNPYINIGDDDTRCILCGQTLPPQIVLMRRLLMKL